jgi:hypothetical protein
VSDASKTCEQTMRELFADDIALEREMQKRTLMRPDRSDEFRRMWAAIQLQLTREASEPSSSA